MIQTLPSARDDVHLLPSAATRAKLEQLRTLVEGNRARWRRLILLEALGLAVAVPLAYLWMVFILDNLVHLPGWGRFLASVTFISGVSFLIYRLAARFRQQRLSEDQVALAMEQRTPGGVQNRLINALQLARDSRGPAQLSEAVVEENYERLKQATLKQAAQARPAIIRLSVAGVLVLVGVIFALVRPAHFGNAAARILLPFAAIDPIYRTTLTVEPGNIEAAGDVTIRIRIHGERPESLTVFREVKGKRSSDVVPISPDANEVEYVFRNVEQTTTYAVRGGDFTSPYYRIEVPTPSLLSMARVTYRFPAYTKLADKRVECAGGDLEALQGTVAEVTFVLDRPAATCSLVLTGGAPNATPQAKELTRISATEFRGEITFADGISMYQLETQQEGRDIHRSNPYALRVHKDQPPKLELRGLERVADASVDAVLPLSIAASDDYGLDKVGLFYRRLTEPPTTGEVSPKPMTDDWKAIETWPAGGVLNLKVNHDLVLAALGIAEGDRLELALRASDTDPLKKGVWTAGTVYKLSIGGEGSALQLIYEQILRSEAEIKGLIAAQQQTLAKTNEWVRKLDPGSDVRWDDAKNLAALAAAVKQQTQEQEELRKRAANTARDMVSQAGNLRLSLGMLADTEMIRANRIYESVPLRDEPARKRTALSDARTTQERIIRSLQDIAEQYAQFRSEWELAHMISFTKMLADRQVSLRDSSLRNAGRQADKAIALQQVTAGRRQAKVLELSQRAGVAFTGLGERTGNIDPILSKAFGEASVSLKAKELEEAMKQAADLAKEGRWSDAAPRQAKAAESLAAIHDRLRKAQSEAALKALTALQERAKSDLQAQKQLEKLQAGTGEKFLDIKDKLKLEEIIHMQEVDEDKKRGEKLNPFVNDYLFPDSARGMLQQADTGKRQEFDILKLAKSPGGEPSFPKQSDRKANTVTPYIQEKFDDLVGKLLEEADDMKKNYETYNLNAGVNINEPGEIGKQAGDLNSTAASAATGNQKPPTVNVGGASRAGRRGARAHGQVVGDESINRRGRDKVQEGQERVGDQAGTIKEKKSEDMQKDTSTGIGGKKVESDDNKFSVADAGKWSDDILKRMGKAQEKHSIVERQDGKMDHRMAEMMRDMEAKHEQMIERIKAIRKELKNLYLPTDHLDEIAAELNANLGYLKERPEAETFRAQARALERLRGTLRVFHQASSGFQPSVARDQAVQGRVLDEPARQTLPGYEEAVKQYYQKLSGR